ncbi:hypothetical protein CfE428DRAFT_5320 [Chthoniobacter flavus Ellin428]|uniref:Uncharacterized protein n=1 Tax=Chthoniobacter flavus Ellin428 TaxID=497964 RepID=B4D8T0_9BACT|nr:hypothetical protein [Chthoniobacter flavus]EDY17138.1 hypothetical protein CfE428DRAFT_5320 [Chthoniobacter flavus Ellin428]TCO90202.1 hypothetical protein EV701_111128 [Chthoniobacter flavus]
MTHLPWYPDNIDNSLAWIFGIVFMLVVMGIISFWPASRGHWSAVLLAAPSVVLGGLLIWNIVAPIRPDSPMPDLWFLFPAPLAVGLASILFWMAARHSRREAQESSDEEPS